MPSVVPRLRPRADRCPGALRVHQAADGALARVRVPGGVLTTSALRALAAAAVDLGDGRLELTSRGNVQLRGLSAEPADTARLAGVLADAGLLPSRTHETVRNVVASPLAGRDGLGSADVRGLADALDVQLCDEPVLGGPTGLSGRFLFGLDDGRGDVLALRPDLTWSARTSSVRVDRWDTHVTVAREDAPAALLAAARQFLAFRDAALRRPGAPERLWRISHLPDGGRALARALGADPESEAEVPDLSRGPLPGPVSSPGGETSLVVLAALGAVSADQALLLAEVAEAAGSDHVIVTPWRSVVVDVAGRDTDAWSRALTGAGLVLDAASPWIGVTACAGTGCPKTLADVRADAARAVRLAPPRSREATAEELVPVHWVGCERACGRPAGRADLLLATPEGYRVHHLSTETPS